MRRSPELGFFGTAAALLIVAAALVPLPAQQPEPDRDESPALRDPSTTDPDAGPTIDLGTVERETVRLVLLDVIVVDGKGDPVPGLAEDDFDVVAGGKPVEIDTMDVRCEPQDATPEAPAVLDHDARDPAAQPRRIALTFDYMHLDHIQRADVFAKARRMMAEQPEDDTEVMVAALTGGLRIEQKFSSDREETLRTLKRMEYDVSLFGREFFHLNELPFVDGLTALMDVLGAVPGTKGVVLFSAMGDVPLDLQFKEIAAVASASRCFVYPVDARGLVPAGLPAGGAVTSNATARPG